MTADAMLERGALILHTGGASFRFLVREGRLTLGDGEPDPDVNIAAGACEAGDLPVSPDPNRIGRMDWTFGGAPRTALFSALPGHPFVSVRFFSDGGRERAEDPILTVSLPSRHLRLRSVSLYDKTDHTDTLAEERTRVLYPSETLRLPGSLFLFENQEDPGASLLLVKDAPTASSSLRYDGYDALIRGTSSVTLTGTGADGSAPGETVELYGCTVGTGPDPLTAYRAWYRDACPGDGTLFVMSNTWGDRSRDEAVCEDFMVREIEAAAALGCDIVQIDDGWQKGATANSHLAKQKGGVWEGYYDRIPDFWTPHPDRFPHGLLPLAELARERGAELGLWFSPDSSDDFRNWRRDVDTLLGLREKYGVRVFKLDGVNLCTKLAETRFRRLLRTLTEESGGEIRYNLDITAQNRLGYLPEKERGTLFVENRYTDWGNYYPKNTLRNLRALSRYLPARKFQFELLNVRRNGERYGDDPFAPGLYPPEWLFCSVMVSNPLVWMEVCHLPAQDAERISGLVRIWRQHRDALYRGDVLPVGEEPDGRSFTGFRVTAEDGDYLILLREFTESDRVSLPLCTPPGTGVRILASSPGGEIALIPGRAEIRIPDAPGWLFAKLEKHGDKEGEKA